eukprot:1159374-Pyramimonas_sp.AAC.1
MATSNHVCVCVFARARSCPPQCMQRRSASVCRAFTVHTDPSTIHVNPFTVHTDPSTVHAKGAASRTL